jgi:hypothetical protein
MLLLHWSGQPSLVGLCTIYEKLYLIKCEETKISNIAKTATGELRRVLVILYTAILRALTRSVNWRWLTLSPGNALENLKSPDATFVEITALDGPESLVNLVVQGVENCYEIETPGG